MKKHYLMWLGLALLFSMFGCQSATDVNIKVNTNSLSTESAGGTQNQIQADTSDNKYVAANPTPTVEDKNKTESIYTDLVSEKCKTIESNPDEGGSYHR